MKKAVCMRAREHPIGCIVLVFSVLQKKKIGVSL
jgi:hypothetical protein